MVAAAAKKAPMSRRVQGQFAMDLFNAGKYEESLAVIDRALLNIPDRQGMLLVARLNILCAGARRDVDDLRHTMDKLAIQYYDPRQMQSYTNLVSLVANDRCPGIDKHEFRGMLRSMLGVPENKNPKSLGYSQLQYLIGYISVFLDDSDAAMEAFSKSLESRPGPSHAMAMAALMATGEFYDEALVLSDRALGWLRRAEQATPVGSSVSDSDIRNFQDVVREDRARMRDGGT
jgi:hypothetical protein